LFAALKDRYVPKAVYDVQHFNSGCMANTRVRILSEIAAWIKDPEAQQILWITGMVGTGKTSIAKTICERAKADADIMLGGSFFCSRSSGVAAQRDIRFVVPTLAQLLSLESEEFCLALSDKIHVGVQDKEVDAQVEELLRTPLLNLKGIRMPILFVIDGLDECGGDGTDELDDKKSNRIVTSMLESLVRLIRSEPKLPVKFMITSRPEPQIRDTFDTNDKCRILRLRAADAKEIEDLEEDIRLYINKTLGARLCGKSRLRAAITNDEVEDILRLSNGLFSVAVAALEYAFDAGNDAVVSQLKKLLKDSREGLHARALIALDRMYALILINAAKAEATDLPGLLRLLASLLSARSELSITALGDLLGLEWYDVRDRLTRLHSVVHVPEDDDIPDLHTVHPSFGDYLFSRAPKGIHTSRLSGHNTLADGCLDIMDKKLHSKIAQSGSSNDSDLFEQPVSITLSLKYACLHWVHHIDAVSKLNNDTTDDFPAFDDKIDRIFRPKFPSWRQVLSVLRQVVLASQLLKLASSVVSRLLQRRRPAHSVTGPRS